MTPRIHPGATEELIASVKWYEQHQTGVGEAFLLEFEQTIDRIAAQPLRFARAENYHGRREIRRALLDSFPFAVVFEMKSDGIVVLAVAHASRRQNFWSRRRD